jgi:Uma2 family endonuclease
MPYILDKQGIEVEEIVIETNSANLTEEQFLNLCVENKHLRFERDKNKNIIIMSPTFTETGNVNGDIFGEVWYWNKQNHLGYCFDSNTGYTLPNGAVRSPDVSWIVKDKYLNLSKAERKSFAHICPDFVIELMSKSDSLKKLMEKMEEWMENGCRLAWLIDPNTKSTHVYKPNMKPHEIPFTETLNGENVLPGFELKLSEIIT